jgi:hypothetical protein
MNWPSLLLAPMLALCDLTIIYAMVTPACTRGDSMPLHAASLAILVACIVMSVMAWSNWRRQCVLRGASTFAEDDVEARSRVMALVAAMTGTLSCLAVTALWFPVWVLSPCVN